MGLPAWGRGGFGRRRIEFCDPSARRPSETCGGIAGVTDCNWLAAGSIILSSGRAHTACSPSDTAAARLGLHYSVATDVGRVAPGATARPIRSLRQHVKGAPADDASPPTILPERRARPLTIPWHRAGPVQTSRQASVAGEERDSSGNRVALLCDSTRRTWPSTRTGMSPGCPGVRGGPAGRACAGGGKWGGARGACRNPSHSFLISIVKQRGSGGPFAAFAFREAEG